MWVYCLVVWLTVLLLPTIALVAAIAAIAPELPRARVRRRCRR